ncbi:hypothetical protein HY030_02235 [Candidatus Gottesmanbacteria bacterium]|nr:hypothetical protein [Candidatus Gottesmanbacteria bacterium]
MKLSFKQALVIVFLILTPLVLSMLPFTIQSIKSPPDRVFMGLHRWSEDYYGYLHTINQGLMGHLQNVNKITLEPHPATFIHSEYAFLGLIGRVFGLNSVMTYHLSRLVLGAIFLFVAFYFFYFLFAKILNTKYLILNTSLAFFLAFFVGGFPYLSWWVELDATRRSTILPHYLMGNILFLSVLILFLSYLRNLSHLGNLKRLLLLGPFSFLLALIHPVDFLILISTLGLFIFLNLFLSFIIKHSLEIRNLKLEIYSLLTVIASGIIPILYIRYALTLPFWRFILGHGTTTKYHIPLFDFVMALGPTFFLAVGGILLLSLRGATFIKLNVATKQSDIKKEIASLLSVARNDRLQLPTGPIFLLLSWLLVQAAFFFKLYEVFNFDRLRTMQPPYYIPLAFFAAIFLLLFFERSEKFLSIKSSHRRLAVRTIILVIFLSLLLSLSLSLKSLKSQVFEVSDFKYFSSFTYPSQKQYEAWKFLRDHTPENSAITALYEARFLLPAVSGNKIAFGANFDNDPDYGKNLNLIAQIYQATLSPQNAYQFLKDHKISYLYFGFQEKSLGGDLTKYDFLSKIFDNGEVAIFAVK